MQQTTYNPYYPFPSPTPVTLDSVGKAWNNAWAHIDWSKVFVPPPYWPDFSKLKPSWLTWPHITLLTLPHYLLELAVFLTGFVLLYYIFRLFLLKKFLETDQDKKVLLSISPPHRTNESAYSTEQLFDWIHSSTDSATLPFWQRLLHLKKTISLEITSSRDEGIRYLVQVSKADSSALEKTIHSYIPGAFITKVPDYLPSDVLKVKTRFKELFEFNFTAPFVFPLADQKALGKSDPMAYLTGHMTKLEPGELMSAQLVLTTATPDSHGYVFNMASKITNRIWNGLTFHDVLYPAHPLKKLLFFLLFLISLKLFLSLWIIFFVFCFFLKMTGRSDTFLPWTHKPSKVPKSSHQEEIYQQIQKKIDANLFEGTLRLFIATNDRDSLRSRLQGFYSSLNSFSASSQSITAKVEGLRKLSKVINKFGGPDLYTMLLYIKLKHRILDFWGMNPPFTPRVPQNMILSTSEATDLYHLPYFSTTKTEGLQKIKSRELPAPLSFKKSTTHLDVVVGKNTHGNEETLIGLTSDNRQGHTYIFGRTGSGKTTIIKTMALQDISSGKGVCVIDPHGDMIQEILSLIPEKRIKDTIYFDPSDKEWPIGLNILSPRIKFPDIDEEHRWITSSLMSVFMKITPRHQWGQRMEHFLRNATLTSLELPTKTPETPYLSLIAIQKLLTSRTYRNKVVSKISDPILKQFWEEEFKRYGSMQQADVTSPLTNKLGEFFTDKMSRNILLQEKSTISIQEIMNEGKILLVNLSKGKLGEERSAFFGTFITSLIQLATYSRESIPESKRREFYVYIDEFQNFATENFIEIFSEARKYKVFFIPSHQNIAQIENIRIPEAISANADNIIAMKNGPMDEKFILPYMEPEVEKGEIVNLKKFHFYMKVNSNEIEDAFSGETILSKDKGSKKTAQKIIENTRKRYATPKKEVERMIKKLFGIEDEEKETESENKETKTFNFAAQNSVSSKERKQKAKTKNIRGRAIKATRKKQEGM